MALYILLKALKEIQVRSFTKQDGTRIPAHKRIVHYSEKSSKSFSNQINDLIEGKIKFADLGKPSKELVSFGMSNNKICITRNVVEKLIGEHDLSVTTIKKLPFLLRKHELVFKSDTVRGRIVVVTSENAVANKKGEREPVIVTIDPNGNITNIQANVITSAYGRNKFNKTIIRWIKSGLLLSDKNKATAYLTIRGLRLPKIIQGNNGGKSARPTNKQMITQHSKNNSSSMLEQLQKVRQKLTKNCGMLYDIHQMLLKAA